MIADAIASAFNDLWAKVVYYVTFQFLDPFYGWLSIGLMAAAVVFVICWFFSPWWDKLRPIGGVIIMLITFGLYAYWRGEKEAREHDKKKRRR